MGKKVAVVKGSTLESAEIVEPPTQDKGLLEIVSQKIRIARGMHKESRIGLWTLNYTKVPATGVFVYPGDYPLSDKKIIQLDGFYSGDIRMIEFREFKDMSFEELDALFLRKTHSLPSVLDNRYKDANTLILNHLYTRADEENLKEIILGLKD